MVRDLVPGHDYDLGELLRRFGPAVEGSSILRGRDGIALLVKPGAAADHPSFPNRCTLHWPGEVPRAAVERNANVLVFVDRGDSRARFIGAARATSYSTGKGLLRNMEFSIEPALARQDWLELIGPLPPIEPAPEAAIANLTSTSSAEDRWTALEVFLERWYLTPPGTAPAVPTWVLGLGPPLLHKMLGVQAAINVFQQNELVRAEQLAIEDGKIVFLVENQSVCLWATEPAGDDPRVWYRNNDEREPWLEEPERLSGFLIQAVLFEAILHARFGAHATDVAFEVREAILARVDALGSGRWNWSGARFYARAGALVMTMEYEGLCDVWLAARTPLALSAFDDLVTEGWEHVAF